MPNGKRRRECRAEIPNRVAAGLRLRLPRPHPWQGPAAMVCWARGAGHAMWIKAIFPVGVLAMAVLPRLVPVAATAPGPLETAPLVTTGRQASFAPVCRNDEVLDSRPDPAWMQGSFIHDGCRM